MIGRSQPLFHRLTNVIEFTIFTAAFAASFFGVEFFRRWSLRSGLVDIPNNRSSHETPTPRGGGLVFVIVSLLLYAAFSLLVPGSFSWSYFIGAVLVALVSWLDDLYSISDLRRFLVHSAAAAILVGGLGYWREVSVPVLDITLSLGPLGAVITFLWVVWMVNAYNFIDGIDGLAGLQAVSGGTGWFLYAMVTGNRSVYLFSGVLIFSCLGFLIHNWHPAKIFMGDVGSAFLGFTFAALPLLAAAEQPERAASLPAVAVLFVWFVILDTLFTFFYRSILGGKILWRPHREHLYQHLVISGLSHSTVTIFYGTLAFVVTAATLMSLVFRGSWEFLPLFTLPLLSLLLILLTFSKKKVDRSI